MVQGDINPKSRFLFPKMRIKLMPLGRFLLLEWNEKSHWKEVLPLSTLHVPPNRGLDARPSCTNLSWLSAEYMGVPTVALISLMSCLVGLLAFGTQPERLQNPSLSPPFWLPQTPHHSKCPIWVPWVSPSSSAKGKSLCQILREV